MDKVEIGIWTRMGFVTSSGGYIYEVIGETPQRWKVARLQAPKGASSWSGPHRGNKEFYFDKGVKPEIIIRDDEHALTFIHHAEVLNINLDAIRERAKAEQAAAWAKFREGVA